MSSHADKGVVLKLCAALLPGIVAMTWLWGWGVLWNAGFAVLFCYGVEIICLTLRQQALTLDVGTLFTGLLIAICLPPFMSVHALLLAALAAIGLAKHAFGGPGRHLFNPAMVGFAVVLVSFPEALSWPRALSDIPEDMLLTGATLLSDFRYRSGMTGTEFATTYAPLISHQFWVAMAFALGGAVLLGLRIIPWRLPAALALGVALGALFGYDQGSSVGHGGWWFHMTQGGLMAAAFFVVTDPVTHPVGTRQQWLYGILIGLLIYLIRAFGAYPDGIAFAVLLANCATPLLDRASAKLTTADTTTEAERS